MASTVCGRGSDDRRSPILASSKTGGKRVSSEIPAHRAGRRFPVRATGLRLALAYVSVAATSLVALAFLIPLGTVVQKLVQERALADAKRQAVVAVSVLTVTVDPAAVEKAITKSEPAAMSRVSVHNLSSPVGPRHARMEDISHIAAEAANGKRGSSIVDVSGGLSYLEAVDIGSLNYAVIEVYVPNSDLHRGIRQAWLVLTAVALGLVITSIIVSDRLAAKVVRSARQLAEATRSLGEGHLDVRVVPSGPQELADAGIAFNIMANRITALLANERELIADLSHRLRTPLTALRLDAEALEDTRVVQRIQEAISALESEVDEIIRVARQQSATVEASEKPHCDVSEVVSERMTFWSAIASDQNRECRSLGVEEPAPVRVPRSELAAALDALLGNVIRYTPQGAPFEIAVSRRTDGYIAVRIDDGGPGIADPERALKRGASDRGSTGLGLDIVRRVAVAGQGVVNIGKSRLGGASVVILLADGERPPSTGSRFGLIGRLSREPNEQRPSQISRRRKWTKEQSEHE